MPYVIHQKPNDFNEHLAFLYSVRDRRTKSTATNTEKNVEESQEPESDKTRRHCSEGHNQHEKKGRASKKGCMDHAWTDALFCDTH